MARAEGSGRLGAGTEKRNAEPVERIPWPVLSWESTLEWLTDGQKASVIVDGGSDMKALDECLRSIVRWSPQVAITVLSGAGTPEALAQSQSEVAAANGARVVVTEPNKSGICASTAESDNWMLTAQVAGADDAVLFSSACEVGPGWLSRMRLIAYSRLLPVVVVAGNQEGSGTAGDWPVWLTWPELSRAVSRMELPLHEVPSNTQWACRYVPASVRDARSSGGVGTESITSVWTPHVMVRHLVPTTAAKVRPAIEFESGPIVSMSAAQHSVRARSRVLPRVLYYGNGDLPEYLYDLRPELAETQESFELQSVDHALAIRRLGVKTTTEVMPLGEETPLPTATSRSASLPLGVGITSADSLLSGALAQLMIGYGIDLIHVVDTAGQLSTMLCEVADHIGIRVVLNGDSLDTSTVSDCLAAHDLVDVVFATSAQARNQCEDQPDLARRLWSILPGARAVPGPRPRDLGGREPGPLRIAIVGLNEAPVDWETAFRELAYATGLLVEWHVVLPRDQESSGPLPWTQHPLRRIGNLWPVVSALDPDFVVVAARSGARSVEMAIESWNHGIPLLALSNDLVSDLVTATNAGVFVSAFDLAGATRRILDFAEDPDVAGSVERGAISALRGIGTVVEDLRELYGLEGPVGRQPRGHSPLKTVGYVVRHPRPGVYPATVAIRVLSRANEAARWGHARFRMVNPHDFVTGEDSTEYDVVLVQRDALPSVDVEPFLRAVKARGADLVLEVDDDLVTEHALEHLAARGLDEVRLAGVRRVAAEADRVIVSTAALASVMSSHSPKATVTVIPNALDRRLWLPEVDAAPTMKDDEIRILYAGSATHTRDLAIVAGLPAALSQRLGRSVVLEVVGVTDQQLGLGCRRLQPPSGMLASYVTWARQNAARWSLAVAPLDDTVFTQSKSDIKLLEYAMLGLPAVASIHGPYQGWNQHAVTLAANGPVAWIEACEKLLSEPALAAARVRTSRELVSTGRLLDAQAVQAWIDVLLR